MVYLVLVRQVCRSEASQELLKELGLLWEALEWALLQELDCQI